MSVANFVKLIPRLVLATPFRLFAIYVSLFCVAVAAVFIYVNVAMQGFLAHEAEAAVQTDFDFLAARYNEGGPAALGPAIAERSAASNNGLYLLTDANGRWLAGNLEAVAADLWATQGAAQFAYRKRGSDARQRQAFGVVTRLPNDLHLIVARDIENQETLKRLLRTAFLLGYALIIAIGAAGAVIVSRRMLRRVDEASSTARAIMQGNLAQRVPVRGHADEFDRLSENLNAMLDRIQDLMIGLKNVSDNIAHDLKTPLHRLRTRAERALQSSPSPEKLTEALGSVIEEADTLIQTFDALLSIARLEAGSRSESFGPLNVCALLNDVAELYEPAAEEQGLSLVTTCASDAVMIAGEKHLIVQAVANLLDNAMKYAIQPAPEGGAKHPAVELGLEDRGDFIDILVSDNGPGIPEADRERVLQRFVRLQPSRSIPGSGLGLSLVAAVARLHEGSVSLEDNGPGLRVRLRLKKNLVAAPQKAPGEEAEMVTHAA
ncbi:ATP-binding protein [Rhodomicrobium sp.]|uniref:sensor histidine kinase n=1 Tax=Rhodomicrobium sp. TaxID=2720632 RepID=UPI0039E37190